MMVRVPRPGVRGNFRHRASAAFCVATLRAPPGRPQHVASLVGPICAVLGSCGSVLGPSGDHLGPSRGPLGPSWYRLEPS
eukprot:2039463-Pyramimonas_sp.AAC.3